MKTLENDPDVPKTMSKIYIVVWSSFDIILG